MIALSIVDNHVNDLYNGSIAALLAVTGWVSQMDVDFTAAPAQDRYRYLTSFVGPRPIALVSTCSADGQHNAAPMSFFNVFSHDPALLVLGLQPRRNGTEKDTMRNIRTTGEFVINLIDLGTAQQMLVCGLDPGSGVDEIALAGLSAATCASVRAPRITQCPCAFECRLERVIDYPRRAIIIGEVVHMWVDDDCLQADGRTVDPSRYQPIARLHDDNYIVADRQFQLLAPELDALHFPRKVP